MARRPRRESKGRQKLELVKMKNPANLLVTYCRRRQGICRKVHELCTLTGANAAVIGFSPKNRPFSFGCPSVPCILDKYQNPEAESSSTATEISGFDHLKILNSMGREKIMSLEEQIREAKKRGENLDAEVTKREKYWWEVPIEELTLEESEKFKTELLNLRANLMSTGMDNPQFPLPPTNGDFGFPHQFAAAFPSSLIPGGDFAGGGASSSINYQGAGLMNPLEIQSAATAGTLEFAGPSRIDTNVQPIPAAEKSPIHDLYDYDSLLKYCDDESEFLNLLLD